MKKYGLIFSGALILSTTLVSYTPLASYGLMEDPAQPSWGKLGEGSVEPTDNGMTSLNAAEITPVKAIKIKVKRGGINLHRCEVWFANGTKKSIDLRNDVPAGSESREIDLTDKSNAISKVVFWYDTRNYGKQKSDVELWGKS
jgi:hypothetical protein